jgi:hypothetical protein
MPPWEWRKAQREDEPGQGTTTAPVLSGNRPPTTFVCGAKKICGEMSSCAEAQHYLRQCGVSRLDGDADGIPCEKLCR